VSFKSREAEAIDTVQEQLAAEKAALADAEQELRDRALQSALSPDEFAVAPIQDAVRRHRDNIERLEFALKHAKALEQQRIARAEAEKRIAENRAIAQHRGALLRAAKRFEIAVAEMVKAFDDMVKAGDSIRPLLPATDHDGFASRVAYKKLRQMCEWELFRVGGEIPNAESRSEAPGSIRPNVTVYPKNLRSLSVYLDDHLKPLYERLVGDTPSLGPISDMLAGDAAPPKRGLARLFHRQSNINPAEGTTTDV
jgi:hypothetical protein